MKKKETAVEAQASGGESAENAPKKVFLKQYLVSGSKDIYDPDAERKAAFVVHTCAKSARDEFKSRFGMDVESCVQTAESDKTKDDMPGKDFWAERVNWEMKPVKAELTPSAKKYFRMKDKAEFVQSEKRRLGIRDWGSATAEQIDAVDRSLSEWEKSHPI